MNDTHILAVRQLVKHYDGGTVEAIRNISFEARGGEILAITGPSGCGKSTLLALIGLLDRPTAGSILVGGLDLATIRDPFAYRACSVGFVFQFHPLISSMTLAENVAMPMIARKVPRAERRARALELLARMDLGHRAHFLPSRVSGGERQRAAVARALANGPSLLLADEPTGNLDSVNGARVVDLFIAHARDHGGTVVLATHNLELAARADRTIDIRDGQIVRISPAKE